MNKCFFFPGLSLAFAVACFLDDIHSDCGDMKSQCSLAFNLILKNPEICQRTDEAEEKLCNNFGKDVQIFAIMIQSIWEHDKDSHKFFLGCTELHIHIFLATDSQILFSWSI